MKLLGKIALIVAAAIVGIVILSAVSGNHSNQTANFICAVGSGWTWQPITITTTNPNLTAITVGAADVNFYNSAGNLIWSKQEEIGMTVPPGQSVVTNDNAWVPYVATCKVMSWTTG
jgi:hypothetical protein